MDDDELAQLLADGYDRRVSLFDVLPPVTPGDVVLLGDSITEGGWWQDWFPGLPIRNRGISGDTTAGVLRRLQQVLHEPAQLFLLIGTNDITFGVADEDVVGNLSQIVGRLRLECPDTEVVVQSLLPRTPEMAPRLRGLNEGYARIAAEHGATWLDLWPAFAGAQDELRAELTNDDLHLVGAGYAVWVEALRRHVTGAA